jgi:hypothetical protein
MRLPRLDEKNISIKNKMGEPVHLCTYCKKKLRFINDDPFAKIRSIHKSCFKRRMEEESIQYHHITYVLPLMQQDELRNVQS